MSHRTTNRPGKGSAKPAESEATGSRDPGGPGFEGCLFGRCRLELSDFEHAIRQEPKTRALVRAGVIVGGTACVLGLYLATASHLVGGLLLLGLGGLLGSADRAPELLARRWLEATPAAERELRLTANDQGLIVSTTSTQRLYPYRALEGFLASRECLLVWVSRQHFLVLPRRAFSESDAPRVIELLDRQVGPPPPVAPLWLQLALTIFVAIGALALWNYASPR